MPELIRRPIGWRGRASAGDGTSPRPSIPGSVSQPHGAAALVNRDDLQRFFSAMFRYADRETYVSLRTFSQHDRGRPPLSIKGIQVSDARLNDELAASVLHAANAHAVFAPPVATFNNPKQAAWTDLANGLAITVDIDAGDTYKLLEKLEYFIGAATVVVRSGGSCTAPASGKTFPRLHAHWRLSEPTREPSAHNQLALARHHIALLVHADVSGASPVHPFRWPGSVHIKDAAHPVSCKIERIDELAEVHLEDAVEKLNEAVNALALGGADRDGHDQTGDQQPVELHALASALAAIPIEGMAHVEWIVIGMAIHNATGGTGAGLELFDKFSRRSPAEYDRRGLEAQWRSFARKPPGKQLRTVGTIYYLAQQHGWQFLPRQEAKSPPPSQNEQRSNGPHDQEAEQQRDEKDQHAGEEDQRAREESLRTNKSDWPEPLAPVATPGIVGDFVSLLEPHTEADTAALVFQFLAAVGNVIGADPYCLVESDKHTARLNVLLVGLTAKGRKGTSWGRVRSPLSVIDPKWVKLGIVSGLSSGEGLIYPVRDPVEKHDTNGDTEIVDAGVTDKRLLVISTEFAGILPVMTRSGNTLSPIIRDAWDHGNLQTLTRNSPLRATGAHISQIGHCTANELLQHLDAVQVANGFANRYLYVCVRRARTLPDGGGYVDWNPFAERLNTIITKAKCIERVTRDAQANALWHAVYDSLSAPRPGLLGAIVARAEAQVLRLALIYALLGEHTVITEPDLQAALECWRYAEQSAHYIFTDKLGDPIADTILTALRAQPDGLTATDIRDLFQRNAKSNQIDRALQHLHAEGLATFTREETGGRPATRWRPARR